MKLVQVPWICDSPEARGQFILSTNTNAIGYITKSGNKVGLNPEVQDRIRELFAELAEPWQPGEVIAKIEAPPRPVIPILAYVESVERLVKALR